MVLATREDAQFLSDAVQGDGDPLSVLQEFERSPRPTLEELKPFEYEILSDLTTSMIYIVGDKVLLKLEEKMNSDEARPYAKPLENFYNRITDLVSEMQQRRVVRKATIDRRDEIVVVHDKVWNSFYKNLRSPSGSISKGLDKMKKAWASHKVDEVADEWFDGVDDAFVAYVNCFAMSSTRRT